MTGVVSSPSELSALPKDRKTGATVREVSYDKTDCKRGLFRVRLISVSMVQVVNQLQHRESPL